MGGKQKSKAPRKRPTRADLDALLAQLGDERAEHNRRYAALEKELTNSRAAHDISRRAFVESLEENARLRNVIVDQARQITDLRIQREARA